MPVTLIEIRYMDYNYLTIYTLSFVLFFLDNYIRLPNQIH